MSKSDFFGQIVFWYLIKLGANHKSTILTKCKDKIIGWLGKDRKRGQGRSYISLIKQRSIGEKVLLKDQRKMRWYWGNDQARHKTDEGKKKHFLVSNEHRWIFLEKKNVKKCWKQLKNSLTRRQFCWPWLSSWGREGGLDCGSLEGLGSSLEAGHGQHLQPHRVLAIPGDRMIMMWWDWNFGQVFSLWPQGS